MSGPNAAYAEPRERDLFVPDAEAAPPVAPPADPFASLDPVLAPFGAALLRANGAWVEIIRARREASPLALDVAVNKLVNAMAMPREQRRALRRAVRRKA